jgi:hypothetical protein
MLPPSHNYHGSPEGSPSAVPLIRGKMVFYLVRFCFGVNPARWARRLDSLALIPGQFLLLVSRVRPDPNSE